MEVTDDGMIFMSSSDELDGGGRYWGEGIPIAHNGGVHYENKWNNDKESINTNYKAGSLNVKINKNTINQRNLPDAIFNTNSTANTENDMFRQKIDATYNIKLDTTSNLKVTIDGTLKNSESDVIDNSVGRRGDNSLLNTADRKTDNKTKQQVFNLSAFYTKNWKSRA